LDNRDWNKTEINAYAPIYQTSVVRCGWYDTWRKYGLAKYGPIYCAEIDKNILFGFNPQLRLTMGKVLVNGDDCCCFQWIDCCFAEKAEFDGIMDKRARLLPDIAKGFLYQAGHLLSAMQRTICLEHGLIAGDTIIDRSLREYAEIFSEEKAELIHAQAQQNFLMI
jgi:hypothetical protein